MENQNTTNVVLENQEQIETNALILKKVKFTREQVKKLEIMTPFYFQDVPKLDAVNSLVVMAVEHFFNDKFKKDINNV